MRIPVPDTHLAVEERGIGPPIVLVHGGTGTGAFDWDPVRSTLARTFRTIIIDLRGHGGSPAPGWRLGIVRYGLDVHQVMRALGIPRALLVGFSAGANSLLTLAMRRPDVFTGLVTIGASMTSDPSRVHEILTGPWPDDLKALSHEAAEGADHWMELRAALARDWAANNAFPPEQVGRITCSTLIVHGANDRIVPPEQARMLAEAIPESELWIAPGAGHMVQRDAPEAFVERVAAFWDRVERERRSAAPR